MKSVLFATAALAAVVVAPAARAEGLRAEVHGGYDNVSIAGESGDGVAYGVALGFDKNVNSNMSLGIEAGIDDSTTKECAASGAGRACISAGRDLSAVFRVGYNLTETSKLYLLGGYTNTRAVATYRSGTTKTRAASNLDGFRAGAGYQFGISDKFYGKVEYRYSNYEADVSRHQGLVGVGVNF
ncbi:outer membrane protein [Sphingomonas colocasiae]|uniref:Porin family protein n=1 Tax=Sphingomonas colocasiae TaxID=1848973 RepID=A0ABS7PV14_9SPHN|nr:outer membrane beta-barrel protein [Sphingomonas colocasiae]MBY8825200.1 porin family protein [Sphingomonas colocasiae]